MIQLSRLNGEVYYLNPNHIEMIEEKPDTTITLITEKKLIVKDKTAEIVVRIIEYNRKIFLNQTRVK